MKRILIAYIGLVNIRQHDVQIAFYESLAQYLSSLGHDVTLWNCWSYIYYNDNAMQFTSTYVEEAVKEQIVTINPDCVIDFNGVLPPSIYAMLNGSYTIFCADNLEYMCHIERIHTTSINYLSFNNTISQQLTEELAIAPERIFTIGCATGIQAISYPQDKNIVFLGTNFGASIPNYSDTISANYALYRAERYIKPIIEEIQKNFYVTTDMLYEILRKRNLKPHKAMLSYVLHVLRHALAKEHRISCLSHICDLGLHLYGPHINGGDWNDLLLYNLPLALCYSRKGIYSLQDNERLYNSSNIGINISHLQARGGFSWRVPDIMASNACIVTEKEETFAACFEAYFTKEQLECIQYTDKYDLREKIQELMHNNDLRKAIVEQSHIAIDEKCRWHHFLPQIEQACATELAPSMHGIPQGRISYIIHPITPPPSLG